MKTLLINSSIKDRVDYKSIKIIQGDLKDLLGPDYMKFKSNVLLDGFIDPVDVWQNKEGELCSLGGTQRLRLLSALENEGYSIPLIPVNRIEAKSLEQAKKIILSLASQYGKFSNQGLMEFVHDLGFDSLNQIEDTYCFAGLDLGNVADEFLQDHTDKKNQKEKKKLKCPSCDFEW